MIYKGGLFVKKQEMTKLRVGHRFVPVTLVMPLQQSVARHKTVEKDGYSALVVQIKTGTKKGKVRELRVDEATLSQYMAGSELDVSALGESTTVRVTGESKGK